MAIGAAENRMDHSMIMHTLKVQDMGDHYRRKVIPQIRLQGKWLLSAGIIPEAKVEVINPKIGVLIVRVIEN